MIITAFESEAKCVGGVIKHLATCPIADIGNLQKSVRDISAGREDTVCIEYCTNNEEKGENEIVEVFQKGFKLGDKVIRFAMVKVAN